MMRSVPGGPPLLTVGRRVRRSWFGFATWPRNYPIQPPPTFKRGIQFFRTETTEKTWPEYRLAICGAGAAGLSTLKAIRKKWIDKNLEAKLHVDLYDASILPLGLLRLGVAPDHKHVKQIGENLIETVTNWNEDGARSFSFDFYGGVEVGRSVTLAALRNVYDSIILATGSYAPGDTSSPALEIENEYAPGVMNSREFVAFYNGHSLHPPDHLYRIYGQLPGPMEAVGQWVMDPALLDYSLARSYSLTSVGLDRIPRTTKYQMGSFLDYTNTENDRVLVVGQGNVSADIARILLLDPDKLPGEHMNAYAKEALEKLYPKYVRDVVIAGRRGALQASWDTATLRELSQIADDVKLCVKPAELLDSLEHPLIIKSLRRDRPAKRMVELLEDCAKNYEIQERKREAGESLDRQITLRYLTAPISFKCDPAANGAVCGAELAKNKLDPDTSKKEIVDIGAVEDIDKEVELIDRLRLVIKSIGYGCAGQYNRARWRTLDTNHKPCKTFVFPRPWKCSESSFKVAEAEKGKGASIFGAGWFHSNGRGSLGNTMSTGPRVAEQVLDDILGRDPCGRSEAFRKLTMTLVVPEIGVPISWQEALKIMDHERKTGQKLAEWHDGVDLVNRCRAQLGPRGKNWLKEMAEHFDGDHHHA
eukprot:Blabericola_migrator_1__2829@NODE_1809_length_3758_cov_251_341642_g1164_i0_p1_GENE_NODE_1809_length_3758_cov_251_341642_g1164_i0NODE_1809_length_3758_cov_251_341642_g1164_i0_p1_ORF_typecomplete_len647_score115_47Pyr_redox_2/PF07992_14/2_8e11FMOlike/PF00743_19/8_6FMOlike/PF00743_19/8_1e02FMOlike/PF00743_19/15FMOlike/PF00743_19/9_7e03Shikimate_DH/PF01488_20/33Shikimate_DH/PF01488_20/3_1e03Shikimate_DH/PF01488_20/19Shikimate_DH/PF01488_20/1_3e03Pyr_redox_3/PF13738_6/4_3e02Pyr_redox_3/PF13738_6/1e04